MELVSFYFRIALIFSLALLSLEFMVRNTRILYTLIRKFKMRDSIQLLRDSGRFGGEFRVPGIIRMNALKWARKIRRVQMVLLGGLVVCLMAIVIVSLHMPWL